MKTQQQQDVETILGIKGATEKPRHTVKEWTEVGLAAVGALVWGAFTTIGMLGFAYGIWPKSWGMWTLFFLLTIFGGVIGDAFKGTFDK